MTAEQCLNHVWLHRKPPKLKSSASMEVTKDNLKQFVERWNEHPNSPYVFEITNHLILSPSCPGIKLSNSWHSLSGMSPSPCGSLASSPGSDSAFLQEPLQNGHLFPLQLDHIRRASDSSCIIKGTDVAERVNLAEEIKKLSDKLFKLSTMNTSITNTEFEETFESIGLNHSKMPKSEPINIKTDNKPPQGHEGVPWRRPKFKLTNMSRDVPIAPKKSSPSFQEQFNSRLSLFTNSENVSVTSPTDTKDMLLQLLEQWDGPQGSRSKARHASVSTEWTENDALGQKTISSLNTFFQSRAANKKVTNFHKLSDI